MKTHILADPGTAYCGRGSQTAQIADDPGQATCSACLDRAAALVEDALDDPLSLKRHYEPTVADLERAISENVDGVVATRVISEAAFRVVVEIKTEGDVGVTELRAQRALDYLRPAGIVVEVVVEQA